MMSYMHEIQTLYNEVQDPHSVQLLRLSFCFHDRLACDQQGAGVEQQNKVSTSADRTRDASRPAQLGIILASTICSCRCTEKEDHLV